jgi:hypothetical protein
MSVSGLVTKHLAKQNGTDMLGKRDLYLNKKTQIFAIRMRRQKTYRKQQDVSNTLMLHSKKRNKAITHPI